MHHHLVLCIILACLVLFSQSFVQLRTKNHATSQALFRKSRLFAKKDFSPPKPSNEDESSVAEQGLTYTVEMSKTAGISWGTDISFRWVYVFDLEPQGEAAGTKLINKGDYIIGVGNSSLIAQDFDYVLTTLSQQPKTLTYTFFRGKKEQLVGEPVLSPSETTCTVTVLQQGKPDLELQCPGGTNLRKLLVGNGINVYRSITRWTNCNGQQRCGTCIVDIKEGEQNCTRRALDEELVLSENPITYRLSCVTSVFGDITVEVQGPVGAAQWTR